MSSHTTVRDNQEFALLIADGEACSKEMLDQLLEWNPFVAVLDGALPRLTSLGIKADAWIGDFDDFLSPEEIAAPQMPIEVVHRKNQDNTDFEKGVEYLLEKGFKEINVVWATGRRADHTMANISSLAKFGTTKITLIDDYSRIYLLPKQFEKWYAANEIISLMPIGKVNGITTKGLAYPLENGELEFGERVGSSNHTVGDGFVQVTYKEGNLLMMECRDYL